jgi:dihydrofolate synthase/folylpolyglutamate synthase
MAEEARREVERRASEIGARLLDSHAGVSPEQTAGGLDVPTPRGIHRGLTPLPGAHQRDNLIVAIRVLESAAEAGLRVDFDALARATAATRWPGRLQLVDGNPPILLDGAHNPAGARALADHLRTIGPFVLVFGAMEDKDVEQIGRTLFPLAEAVVLARARSSDRAATPQRLAERAGRFARQLHQGRDVATALALARRLTPEGGTIVVAGSLYLVGEVLELCGLAG